MKKLSNILLTLSGLLLIYDAYLMANDKPNPIGLPLPCPITISMLGAGTVLSVLSQKCEETE